MSMFYERTIEKKLRSVSGSFPVLMLTGPRQVGKTTLLRKMADESRQVISLGSPTARALAMSDPELFLQRYHPPVLIDEIQYVPKLFEYIKEHVDTHKDDGAFWLTGSQTFHLMKQVTESLAGRAGVVRMLGLSNCEINGIHLPEFKVDPQELIRRKSFVPDMTISDMYKRIFKGSMPRLYETDCVDREEYFESYLETYISKDIKDLSQVANELSFIKFIGIVAARTASNVNYDTLALESGVSAPTAKQWLSVLVSSGLVALIPPFSNNALKRVIKAPRMYFLDTGLCSYITRWSSPEVLERGAMDGAFFETWVVSEIYKSYVNNGKRPPLYYYRNSNKKEIDIIILMDGVAYPVEIKKGSAPRDATRSFSVLKPIEKEPSEEDTLHGSAHVKTRIGMGAVICMAQDVLPIDRNNWYIPAWLI